MDIWLLHLFRIRSISLLGNFEESSERGVCGLLSDWLASTLGADLATELNFLSQLLQVDSLSNHDRSKELNLTFVLLDSSPEVRVFFDHQWSFV